ncbi:META domain protein [Roseovarius mucosus]|uniref:META domain protein n=1 Tax=Roseovarius mucosus TaxID=215743 RepID=A0A1V0RNV5_9RHOB|nr:META domain-containing protein [Roseovarius mucosus]ARE83262.1 META domain protein [Roseovarius mucosus]
MPRFFLLAGLMAVVCASTVQAQNDEARLVSGAVGYLQRIALPPDARAVVVAEGRFGAMLGEVTLDADGKQVPLPFEMTVPANLSGRLSAVIRVNNQPRWLLRDLPFADGTEPVDLGELILEPVTALAFAVDFICGDTTVSFGILGEETVLRAEGRDIPMKQVISASGARFEGIKEPETEFWNKGDMAMLRLEGRDLPECQEVPPPQQQSYRAGGNEPGWSVVLTAENAEITADYGEITHSLPRPDVQVLPGAYVFDMPEIAAQLTIREGICRDDATGMPHPDAAQLTLGEREFSGCGGAPEDLLTGPSWQVTVLGETPLIEPERLTLNFITPGRVAGSSGCNRLVGGYTLTGEGLQFGAMGSTMMACPEPLMEQERRMLDALEQVTRFDIAEDGALRLIGGATDGVLIEARRP